MKAMKLACALVLAGLAIPNLSGQEKPADPAKPAVAKPAAPKPTPAKPKPTPAKPATAPATSEAAPAKPVPKQPSPKAATKANAEPPTEKGKAWQFDGANMIETLRKTAREARLNLVISEAVLAKHGADTVTLMLLDTEPLPVLQVIARHKGLSLEQIGNVYYLLTPAERAARLTRLDDEALPEALARYKQRYLEALRAAGFTREEALRIIVSEPALPEKLKTGTVE